MKWEYAHCKTPVDTPDLLAFLNSMGRDGWELVADLSEYDALWYFIFKRPVKEVEKGRPLQLGERCTNIQCGPALQCERWEGHKGLCTFQGDTP